MHRGKKLRQMRRFICKHGFITEEHSRPPDKFFRPYRKGSYFISFISFDDSLAACVGDVDKYRAYRELVREIKKYSI